VATAGAVLDRPGAVPRERPIGVAAEPVHEAEPRVSSPATNPMARAARHLLAAFAMSATLAVVLFGVMLVVHGGWQAAAAGGSIMAGSAALVAFLIAVTLAERVRR
jgi:hypothetical protein